MSLQIPETPVAGPSAASTSRSHSATRPASAAVHSVTQAPNTQPHPGHRGDRRQRASHQVLSTQPPPEDQSPAYVDVYNHPAALEYAAAHPRRAIPKFGPYLLLQTLGEGEFGKVKLGLHSQWGQEVAVKLIRRGNIDTSVRMSKVEREIEVLRTLKHPNIVRLYDVIETDKYIGIILEYASGGELFDHILAHRYLKEKDACKLFAQLISGVWYIHAKKIVHRDLKLENLLLDRNRNVIITDFGFANRFEHRADDLMQTSCGSPCYAAPELVISEGLYVGSAVDIWSCGVILYAMLAGYLPFDDDPNNPDGDNINLLYKYIVNTPLTFPEYISPEARDLLSMMLVPDPSRRADLPSIMAHNWLAPYAHTFRQTVDELEGIAMEQQEQKRLAYQRQMRKQNGQVDAGKMSRSQSAHTPAAAPGSSSRSRSQQEQPLYETSVDQSMYLPPTPQPQPSNRRGASVAIVPTTQVVSYDDDPFAAPMAASPQKMDGNTGATLDAQAEKKKKDDFRHTIQVEYSGVNGDSSSSPRRRPSESQVPPTPQTPSRKKDGEPMVNGNGKPTTPATPSSQPSSSSVSRKRAPSMESAVAKPLPSPPTPLPPSTSPKRTRSEREREPPTPSTPASPPQVPTVSVSGPASLPPKEPATPTKDQVQSGSGSDTSSMRKRHKKGMSVDKFGLGKLWGGDSTASSPQSSRVPSESSTGAVPLAPELTTATAKGSSTTFVSRRPSTLTTPFSPSIKSEKDKDDSLLSPDASSKKTRRATLTNLISRGRGKNAAPEVPSKDRGTEKELKVDTSGVSSAATPLKTEPYTSSTNAFQISQTPALPMSGNAASTNKARKVMDWFRSRSKGSRFPSELGEDFEGIQVEEVPSDDAGARAHGHGRAATTAGSDQAYPPTPQVLVTPTSPRPGGTVRSLVGRTVVTSKPPKAALRIHHGAVDNTTITTGAPPEVMRHVKEVLAQMGVEVQKETEYKYRCVRAKRRKSFVLNPTGSSLAAFAISGSAASNGVDRRGLPLPSHGSFSSGSGMLRGLLMRRQSSQVSGNSPPAISPSDEVSAAEAPAVSNTSLAEPASTSPSTALEPVYGDKGQDQGDEVRFSVELTRIDRLEDTFSLDIRRLKGNLRSYKFLYDTLRERCDLPR